MKFCRQLCHTVKTNKTFALKRRRGERKEFDELEVYAKLGYAGYEIGLGFKCVEGSPGNRLGNRISVLVSRQMLVGVRLRVVLPTLTNCRGLGPIISEHRHRSSNTVMLVDALIVVILQGRKCQCKNWKMRHARICKYAKVCKSMYTG